MVIECDRSFCKESDNEMYNQKQETGINSVLIYQQFVTTHKHHNLGWNQTQKKIVYRLFWVWVITRQTNRTLQNSQPSKFQKQKQPTQSRLQKSITMHLKHMCTHKTENTTMYEPNFQHKLVYYWTRDEKYCPIITKKHVYIIKISFTSILVPPQTIV